MKWDFDNDRPIYQQIVEQLERAVARGEYSPGDKLPTVRELAANAGVNPNTMQRALAELEHKGLLISRRTSGRFVTDDADRIEVMRGDIAETHTEEYMTAMGQLGYKKQEIIRIIEEQDAK